MTGYIEYKPFRKKKYQINYLSSKLKLLITLE